MSLALALLIHNKQHSLKDLHDSHTLFLVYEKHVDPSTLDFSFYVLTDTKKKKFTCNFLRFLWQEIELRKSQSP